MCRSDALEGLQRVVALLPAHGAAADWIDERGASMSLRSPRTPHAQEAPPGAWEKPAGGGRGHRFWLFRETVARADGLFPGISGPVVCASLGSTKASGRFANDLGPRVGLVFPRVTRFFPRVHFWGCARLSLSSLSFLRERKRERGGRRGRGKHPRIADVTRGYKTDGSWKKRAFHGFSGDDCEPEVQCFQWVSGGGGRSTGFSVEMPLSPRVVATGGGFDGVW